MAETPTVFELDTLTPQEKLDVPGDLLELPRWHRVKTTDLGIPEASYQTIAGSYAAGSDEYKEVCETALQVFLEMMSRTSNDGPRVLRDPSGRPKLGDSGGVLAKKCSRWALDQDDCYAINDTKAAPLPKPGHWKNFVVSNWRAIMPRLVFASDNADPGPSSSTIGFNIETWKNTRDASLADNSASRKALKAWLVPFLKNPVCNWNGRV